MVKGASKSRSRNRVKPGVLPSEELGQSFPQIHLPIQPPYPPAEAKSVTEIPSGPGWLCEPKWDGFRCLALRHEGRVLLQSKAGQPLGRYFPEVVAALTGLPQRRFGLDGEIAIFSSGHLSFDDLLLRIHPAASRIQKLSGESPATLMAFDLLVDAQGKRLMELPLGERRSRLQKFFQRVAKNAVVRLSPAAPERTQAQRWIEELAKRGLDGIVAKRLGEPHRSGERTAMVKIKRIRTADWVVGVFATQKKETEWARCC